MLSTQLLNRTQASNQSDFLEFRFHDFPVKRLHDVLVGTGLQRARDVSDAAFRGAEHHFRLVAARHLPQRGEKLVAVHIGHIPIEQNGIGHAAAAGNRQGAGE